MCGMVRGSLDRKHDSISWGQFVGHAPQFEVS